MKIKGGKIRCAGVYAKYKKARIQSADALNEISEMEGADSMVMGENFGLGGAARFENITTDGESVLSSHGLRALHGLRLPTPGATEFLSVEEILSLS
jgi:hypothetical protein